MKLLLDEDSEARLLVCRLQAAGHDVATVGALEHRGRPDDDILRLARQTQRVLLTRNCADFQRLHDADDHHPGILAVYQERDPRKDMTYEAIVTAIDALERNEIPIAGMFVCLNLWRQPRVPPLS